MATANKNESETKSIFLEKVRLSNMACQSGDFETAIKLYTDAINLESTNHILYSNRSATYIKLGKFSKALADSLKAKELNPEWPKAYYREGVALQCLGRHSDALAAFSMGLAQDPKSTQLLSGLVEAAMKSPLKKSLEPTYSQLQVMKLDKSPFVIISVIGQECLAQGHYESAVSVLESALKIGTCSLKLRGSVFSALSSAYWALNSIDKAIGYMQQDLVISKNLNDISGECRAHGNLGSAYFSKGNYKEALTSHRYQLVLAMKCKDNIAAAAALTSLGHSYTAMGDTINALASHKQCVELVKTLGDPLQEARETGNVGAVYLAIGDFDKAVECHQTHLEIAKRLGNKIEEARAYSNLGSSYHYKRHFDVAIQYHNQVLRLGKELSDYTIEARAYAGLGHASRCMNNLHQARLWHEKQLDMALITKNKVAEGRACSNLGIIYQLFNDHDAALKLHQSHLNIARQLHDKAGMGRAFGNIGNAYSALGYYEQAIKYHKQELTISKEVNDRCSEASTHGNLAVAYQALEMHEMALVHYHSHLNIARELKDSYGEACALCNLGNCHSSRREFSSAVPFYENYLMLCQELNDNEGEAKACHFLGYAHYCLHNYKEAIRYYDQDVTLARNQHDKMNMGRAYCNLGLAHLAIGNTESALECQKYFLTIAQILNHGQAKFRALSNIGDVLLKMSRVTDAISNYKQQLELAKEVGNKHYEASAYCSLGFIHRQNKEYDISVGYHTQELSLLQDTNDVVGECKAHGHLGAVYYNMGNYSIALKCYQEQLQQAVDIKDEFLEAVSYGNLGLTRMALTQYQESIECFKSQIALLNQQSISLDDVEKGRAYGNMGNCYQALYNYEESVKCYEMYLSFSIKSQDIKEQDKAYKGLGLAFTSLDKLPEALVCFEKRLLISHDLEKETSSAYGDLGATHILLGHYEQAIFCLEHQLKAARELTNSLEESHSANGLGQVYHKMGDYSSALTYHELDLKLSIQRNDYLGQSRAYEAIASIYEDNDKYMEALQTYELQLASVNSLNDIHRQTKVLENLGRIYMSMNNVDEAINILRQGVTIAERGRKKKDEGVLHYRLGAAYWKNQNLTKAEFHLRKANQIFDFLSSQIPIKEYLLKFHEIQTECNKVLMTLLVQLGNLNDALVLAEQSRCRENSGVSDELRRPQSIQDIIDIVNNQKGSVIYYSLVNEYLFTWLLLPQKGIVRFSQVRITFEEEEKEEEEEEESEKENLLQAHIQSVRESLGVNSEIKYEESHLEALGDKLNSDGDSTGFLHMVNRSSKLNSSSYSLSSLFSVGSLGTGSSVSSHRIGSVKCKRSGWVGPTSLKALYDILIEPIEEYLLNESSNELIFVLEKDLYLIPFSMLKSSSGGDYLIERFSYIITPSLYSFKRRKKLCYSEDDDDDDQKTKALIIGNPQIPSSVTEHWGWSDIPTAAQEANIIAEVLQTSSYTNEKATKESILNVISSAEVIHFACHVSWKLSAIILSPASGFIESTPKYSIHEDIIHEEESSEIVSISDSPPLSEFLLMAADIMKLKLRAKLVVISSCYSTDENISSEGFVTLIQALLKSGAACVLTSLWSVNEAAVKLLMKALYSSLLQGSRISKALTEAITTVQNTKHFQHPSNWASFILIGSDIKLINKVAHMSQALKDILSNMSHCKEALRVTLHLVEKSLQRINRGYKNAMYTSQTSIENKIGSNVPGWKDLLISVGFRFEPEANGIPSSVFFPQSDPEERLSRCSTSLQAILSLGGNSMSALSKLLHSIHPSQDLSIDIIYMFRQVLQQIEQGVVQVSVRLWRLPGIHELLASLGFDLIEVTNDEEVSLKMNKLASKKQIQFALTALLSIFATIEAPKSTEEEGEEDEKQNETEEKTKNDKDDDKLAFIPISAFSSYVRNRGEPDGQGQIPESKSLSNFVPPLPRHFHTQDHESDNNFTPSPIHSNIKRLRPTSVTSSNSSEWNDSTCRKVSQSTLCSTYENDEIVKILTPVRSVFTELGYYTGTKLTDKFDPNDKFSVRAERKNNTSQVFQQPLVSKDSRLNPGVTTRIPPTGESDHNNESKKSLNRHRSEIPFSEIYHDRPLGLGLAPPLSKLLHSLQVVSVETHAVTSDFTPNDVKNFETISEEALGPQSISINRSRRPPIPPKPDTNWSTRDEGDGRSLTDSQYSGYSPATLSSSLRRSRGPLSLLKYKNYVTNEYDDDEITVLEEKEVRQKSFSKEMPETSALWKQGCNGTYTYTGLFSSDC